MKAILCRRLGGPEVLSLEDVPEPALPPGRVRVRLTAAGVNFPDVLMVAGGYQLRPDLPFVPGMEAAGVVLEAAPDVTGWQAGTRVMVRLRPGAFQEQAVVSPSQLMALPDALDDVHAAAFPIAYLTAWHALVQRGRLAAGEVVLVHGAAGGTGMAAIDVALGLGATVVAVAGGAAKAAFLRARGAHHVVDHRTTAFRDVVLDVTGGRGCDVVFDPVGGDAFTQSLRCIGWRGRLLVIGFAGGTIPELPANYPLLKGCSVIGVRAGENGRHDPAAGRAALAALHDLAAAGVRPHVSHVLPLARAADALRLIRDRTVIGKAVLTIP